MIEAWLLPVPGSVPDLVERVRPGLADWEQARLERFAFEPDRVLYAAAHGLLRLALTFRHPSVPVARWEVERTTAGAPVVIGPVTPTPQVSLSHTKGLVACAVAAVPVGIDVEAVDPRLDVASLFERVLSPSERTAWPAPDDAARRRFFQTWVLKEALLKGLGLGLQCEPATISVAFSETTPPAIVEMPAAIARPADWGVAFVDPPPGHVGAVAHRGPPGSAAVAPRLIGLETLLASFG